MPTKKKIVEITPDMQSKTDPIVASLPVHTTAKKSAPKIVVYPWEKDPHACLFEEFPQVLLEFASKNGITSLKWRIQKGEYILFSARLQKFHIPM